MIYDAFPFLNELELLEIRLHTLGPHVDRFVIVEANQTHSTLTSKDGWVFEEYRSRFQEFLDRVIYVKLVDEFFTVDQLRRRPWPTRLRHRILPSLLANGNENFQRNCLVRGLTEASPDDILIISDVDEIVAPDRLPEAIELLRNHPVVALEQTMYRYFLNNRQIDFEWILPRVTTCGEAMRTQPHVIRGLTNVPIVKNAGWHFSSVGGIDRVRYKAKSFLHHDRWYRGQYRDPAAMERLFEERVIGQGRDIFHFMDNRMEFVEIDESFPPFLRENQERYGQLIHRPEA